MKCFIFLIFLSIPQLALSQTEVNGTQSGIWSAGNSPYLVTGEITVPANQTLSIEPGVEIIFQGHFKFKVNGNLQAVGSESSGILFTAVNQTIGWGGIRIDSSDISTLTYCRLEFGRTAGSYPDNHGGALALFGSDAIISNCIFADNEATANDSGMGGAVYASGTGGPDEPLTRFIKCLFIRNHAYGEGGAIKFTMDMNTEITGCEFIDNNCNYGGGAISFYGVAGTRVDGSLFTDNYTMYGNGGAMNTLGYSNTVFIVNCSISRNTAVTGDGGAINFAYANAFLVNTIVYENNGMYSDDIHLDWGAVAEIHYCNATIPSGATASHNITENPLFVDPDNLDFQLQEDSPCINAGIAYFAVGGYVLVNLDSDQYYGPAPDMGSSEFIPATASTDPSIGSGTADKLLQNYPNPFSSGTAINYALSRDCFVEVKVFDVSGREIRSLVNANQKIGHKSISWDGLDNSGQYIDQGTYFIRMQAGDKESCQRILHVR